MKIGIIGLGKMGSGVAERLAKTGYTVLGYDPSDTARQAAYALGISSVDNIAILASAVETVWLFVPAGDPVDDVLNILIPHMKTNSIIIDGGNSNFHDSVQRAQRCTQHNLFFIDCGTSGGIAGRTQGYSLMIGGDQHAYERLVPLLTAVAAPQGFGYMGPSGTGHYVKMIHNGIEYGIMQAYAEGLHLLKEGTFKDVPLDLATICRVWQHGALLRSYFLDLAHDVVRQDQQLTHISGEIFEGGTGRWTVDEAREHKIPVPVIEASLEVRTWSRATGGNYATKLIALIRHAFGGHAVNKKDQP